MDIESPVELATQINKSLIGTQSLEHLSHILQSLLLIEKSKGSRNSNEIWRQIDNALSSVIITSLNEEEDELAAFEQKGLMKRALKQSLKQVNIKHPDHIHEVVKIEHKDSETQTLLNSKKVAETQTEKINDKEVKPVLEPEVAPIKKSLVEESPPKNYVYPIPPPNLPGVMVADDSSGIPDPPPNMPGVEGESGGDSRIPKPPANMPGVTGGEISGDPRIPKPPPNIPGIKATCDARDTPSNVKSKPEILQKPSCKMRTLKWEKITEKDIQKKTGTLWNEIDMSRYILDTKTISIVQEQYAVQEVKKPTSGLTKEKKEKTSFFDQRANMNISIFLKQFKHDNLTLIIKEGNQSKISLEQMKAFSKLLPETSVVKQIKDYNGDMKELAEADAFFSEFLKLENYDMRVQILTTKLDYSSEYQELKPNIEKIEKCCKEIIENDILKKIMGILLSLGNFINHGSYAGSAAGFKISSLNKLNDTRANKGRMTLLNSLVEIVEEKYPELSIFGDSMQTLEGALRLSIDQLKDSVKALQTKVDQSCRKKVKFADDLKLQVTEFLDLVTPQLEELEKQANHVLDMSSQICQFFAEEPKTFKLEDFMRTLHQFRKDFDKALKDNVIRKETEARKKRIEEKKKDVKNQSLRALGTSTAKQGQEGDIIENLMGEIKRGMTLKSVSLCRENSTQPAPSERRKRLSQRKRSSLARKSQEGSDVVSNINELSEKRRSRDVSTSSNELAKKRSTENSPVKSEKNITVHVEQVNEEIVTEILPEPHGGNSNEILEKNTKNESNESNESELHLETPSSGKLDISKSCEDLIEIEVATKSPISSNGKTPDKKRWGIRKTNRTQGNSPNKDSSGWKSLTSRFSKKSK